MTISARYVHTNLVAHDWLRLVDFYSNVFGCLPVYPERHLEDAWVTRVTGIPSATIHGMHLRLPGYGDTGPTLEIFQYNLLDEGSLPSINRPGLAHLAFAVDNVTEALSQVVASGGQAIGDIVNVEIAGVGTICFVYAADPEGNVIELQTWIHQAGSISGQG